MRKNYRKRKFNKKRKSTYKIFFLILVGMTVGFAAINTTLQLIGTLNISKTTWNIHWENPTKTGGVTATKEVALKENDNTTVEYQVKLTNPGDYYEFTVDAKNDGTIDGMITNISNKVYENNTEVTLPAYLESTITYSDGKTIEPNHLLASTKSETYKVKVAYKTGLAADQLPDSEKTYNFRFTVTYMQADENVTTACGNTVSFADDSWDVIVCNAQKGNLTKYNVGDTKTIEMDVNGDSTNESYTVRIANKTTPTECKNNDFSQSACGFVIEFVDVIPPHRMNKFINGDTTTVGVNNKGGWEYSDMRAYLNSTTYAYENIDYSTTGIYAKMPAVIRNGIINTKVISGHGQYDSDNYVTTDKLYLLSTKELWGEGANVCNENDTALNETRQLDYYNSIGTTCSNYGGIRRNNDSYMWWLRTARSDYGAHFYNVQISGQVSYNPVVNTMGVVPAFRLG